MLRAFVFLAVWIAATATARAAEPIPFGSYRALVIGNNAYSHIGKLQTAHADARAMAELLQRRYGFKVDLLLDAKRYEIVTALGKLRAETDAGDNVVIYYAGHGHLDRETETGYWLPVDAERDNEANWLSVETVTRALRAMPAKHVLVIADSCYSGTLVRAAPVGLKTGAERLAWLRRMSEKRSRTAMVSGGLEPVSDGGGGGHSVFARALLDRLAENADALDAASLFQGLSRQVVLNAAQTPEYSDVRNAGHEGGEFLFVPLGWRPDAPAEAAPAAAAPAPPVGGARAEEAFWDSIKASERPSDYAAYLEAFPNGVFAPLARARKQLFEQPTRQTTSRPEPAAAPSPPAKKPSTGGFSGGKVLELGR